MAGNFFSFLSTKAEVYSSSFSLPHSSFSNSDLFPLSHNFTCLRAQQLPALIKQKRCMEGPALKWTLSEVQLLRLRATFHTLPCFTHPRKFYTRTHVKINRRWKSTKGRSNSIERSVRHFRPPPVPRHPFTCLSKRVNVCVLLYPAQTSHLMQMNKNKRNRQNRGERKIGVNRKISMSIPAKDITVLQ